MQVLHIQGTSSSASGSIQSFERSVVLPSKVSSYQSGGILVIGKFRGNTSSTVVAHMVADNLAALGCQVHRHDCTDLQNNDILPRPFTPRKELNDVRTIVTACAPETSIAALDDFQRSCPEYADIVRKSRRIMCVSWETPQLPSKWVSLLGAFNDIWVPSEFVRNAAVNSLPSDNTARVVVVPHTVPRLEQIEARRAQFDLPEDKLVVLSNFSFRSGMRRKNPLAGIEAFQQAMALRGSDDAVLVIKTSFSHSAPKGLEVLKRHAAEDRRIILMDEIFPSTHRVHQLTKCADVFISFAGAEGFGLTVAEAMRLGRPVIASNVGGHRDFVPKECLVPSTGFVPVTRQCDPDGMWVGHMMAQPNIGQAAMRLADLLDNPQLRAAAGRKVIQHADDRFSLMAFARNISDVVVLTYKHLTHSTETMAPEDAARRSFFPALNQNAPRNVQTLRS